MKQFCIFVSVFLFIGGLSSANAQDMIILRDGNMIEAKVMEIHPSEIRYKRIDNLNGPMIIIPKDRVLSIKYENGVLDIINASPAAGHERTQTEEAGSDSGQQLDAPTPLQIILNALPAIRIAGNNLKFQFGGEKWVATVNGENFSAGTIELGDTDGGSILTLKQTHIWPGAVGRTAGRVANRIPGAAVVGGALDTAGRIAGTAGAIEASGPDIVLEYKAGPPAKLSFIRSTTRNTRIAVAPSDNQAAGVHPLLAENRFDLDGFNVFAISITGMPTFWWGVAGGGITMTIFEGYKPNTFFTPSYFLSGKFFLLDILNSNEGGNCSASSAGVLFKHRFPKNRVLWNLGASLEFMSASGEKNYGSINYTYQESNGSGGYYTRRDTADVDYVGTSFLLGIGLQTGFSFRFNPYTSLDLNGLLKFPFGTVDMKPEDRWHGDTSYNANANNAKNKAISSLPNKSFWPFFGGIELALTFWTPYRSRGQR
jgi:hypothetical protein